MSKVNNTVPVTYDLRDWSGKEIIGMLYEEELVKAKPPAFCNTESVLKQRVPKGKKEYFVKWEGFPSKSNSWVGGLKNL